MCVWASFCTSLSIYCFFRKTLLGSTPFDVCKRFVIVHVSFSLPYFAICDRGARLFEKWYYFVIAFMSLSGSNVFNVLMLLNETAATRRLLSGFRHLGVCRAFFWACTYADMLYSPLNERCRIWRESTSSSGLFDFLNEPSNCSGINKHFAA